MYFLFLSISRMRKGLESWNCWRHLSVCKYLTGECKEDGATLFSVAHRRFSLNRKHFCAVWEMEHWHRQLRGCDVSSLEIFRRCLDVGLLWVALLEPSLGPASLSSSGFNVVYVLLSHEFVLHNPYPKKGRKAPL